jgi:predicted DNA-binding antitoxin AbrB/MazE fold protein
MTKTLQAIFENGALRPLEPLLLKEHQVVTVTVIDSQAGGEDLLDTEFIRSCVMQADDSPTLEQVRTVLSKISGSMAEEIIRERDDRL